MKNEQNLKAIESIRVHTWLSKEFEALAYEDKLLADQIMKYGPAYVAKYNTHVFSQTYEDAAIAEIFSRIGVTSKTFVEIGVEDGAENTTRLLLLLGWRGLWVEANAAHCNSIRSNFSSKLASGQLQLVEAIATPESIQEIIDSAKLGSEIDFLSVDVDQHTSHIFQAIATKPRAACIEYNAHFPPVIDYEVPYKQGDFWNGSNIFGASLKRLEKIGYAKKLSLVGCDLHGVNAYFVANDLTNDLFPTPFTAEHHYQPPRYQYVRGQRGHRRQLPGER